MGFSKKIKEYFESKGLNNREVSKIMDGYSESMISKYINSDNISHTFLDLLRKYFPDVDFNYLLKDEPEIDLVREINKEYKNKSLVLVEEIEAKLAELKSNLAR